MSVYVTAPRPSSPGGVLLWARLFADTDTELEAMVARLGAQGMGAARTATQDPYYVIDAAQRADALAAGAKAVRAMRATPAPAPEHPMIADLSDPNKVFFICDMKASR